MAAVALLGIVTLAVANSWVLHTSAPFVHRRIDQLPARDVALVPGVGELHNRLTANLKGRLQAALAVYRAHKVKAILVSGVAGEPGEGDELETSRHWLENAGVPAADIIVDGDGSRTVYSMQRAAHVLHVASAVVCTQDSHLYRAVFLARTSGIDAVGMVAPTTTPANGHEMGREILKAGLAFVETYVLRRVAGPAGPTATIAAAPASVVRALAATATQRP